MIEKGLSSFFNRFPLSPNRKKVAKNLYWAVFGKGVSVLGELLVGVFIARTLGPEQFGLMNYVISYVMIFSVLARFGLDGIEIRELSKPETNRGELLGTALGLRLLFSLLTVVLIAISLWQFEADSYTRILTYVYAGSVIFSSFTVFRNYFTSVIQHEFVVKSEIFRTILGGVIKLLILWMHPELLWVLGAFAFDTALISIGYWTAFRKHADRSIGPWSFKLTMARILIRNAFPLLLSAMAIVFYQKINAIMIRNLMDETSLGYYAVAAKIVDFSVFIPVIIGQSVSPLLVKAHAQNNTQYALKRQEFMDWMLWGGALISLILCVTSPLIILMLYGEAYRSAIPVLQILSWKVLFFAWLNASGELIIIENLQRYAILRNLTGTVISFAGNLLLIPILGVMGSSLVLVFTIMSTGFLANLIIPKYRHIYKIQLIAIPSGIIRIKKSFHKQ